MSTYTDFHRSREFLDLLREYHLTHARQPTEDEKKAAKKVLTPLLEFISSKMKDQGVFICSRYEHRGSSYEGVKVKRSASDPDLEFDIMFVIEGGGDLTEPDVGSDGYADLKPKMGRESRKVFQKTMVEGGFISAAKTRREFQGELTKALKEKTDRGECTIHEHGPAMQINVYKENKGTKKLYFSVDLAPHYDIREKCTTGEGNMYVPKAPTKEEANYVRWFRSFSLDEKKMIDGIDQDKGCRKMVLRITKALRWRCTTLAKLQSHQLKTAWLWVVKAQPDWHENQLGPRLVDVLIQLEDRLKERRMKHYFMPDVNVIKTMKADTMDNIAGRINKLRTKENDMKALLSRP